MVFLDPGGRDRLDGRESEAQAPVQSKPEAPTSLKKRLAAGLAALFVLALTAYYIYSIFTGGIFKW